MVRGAWRAAIQWGCKRVDRTKATKQQQYQLEILFTREIRMDLIGINDECLLKKVKVSLHSFKIHYFDD